MLLPFQFPRSLWILYPRHWSFSSVRKCFVHHSWAFSFLYSDRPVLNETSWEPPWIWHLHLWDMPDRTSSLGLPSFSAQSCTFLRARVSCPRGTPTSSSSRWLWRLLRWQLFLWFSFQTIGCLQLERTAWRLWHLSFWDRCQRSHHSMPVIFFRGHKSLSNISCSRTKFSSNAWFSIGQSSWG